jgi:hypothetical protein
MFVCSVYMPVCIHTRLDYKRMVSQLVYTICIHLYRTHEYRPETLTRQGFRCFQSRLYSSVVGVSKYRRCK